MDGLLSAARAVQSAAFLQSHGHLLERPQGVPSAILDQLRRAAQVSSSSSSCFLHLAVKRDVFLHPSTGRMDGAHEEKKEEEQKHYIIIAIKDWKSG